MHYELGMHQEPMKKPQERATPTQLIKIAKASWCYYF